MKLSISGKGWSPYEAYDYRFDITVKVEGDNQRDLTADEKYRILDAMETAANIEIQEINKKNNQENK